MVPVEIIMAANYLEQLLAEWYEYQGYFLRCNVNVGRRKKGGYECELDIVGFNPKTRHLLHVEPTMDSDSWAQREKKFTRKFNAGKKYIHSLFDGLDLPEEIDHRAVFVYASSKTHKTIGGGRVMHLSEILADIFLNLRAKRVSNSAIPEHLAILRSFQFVAEYRKTIIGVLANGEKA